MNKAIFLDRDGTLIKEKNYLSNIKDIQFLEGTYEGLKKLQNNYLLIIVTNQSGVARGFFDENTVLEVNKEIERQLKKIGVNITETLYCPHHKNGIIKKYSIDCNCRKPKIGLIEEAVKKYNIDLSKSYIIGDKDSDIELGYNCNCKTIFISNNNYVNNLNPDFIAKDILDAANYIIERKEVNK